MTAPMPDDILDTVRSALAAHDAKKCECYRRSMSMCVIGSEREADEWFRALVAEVERLREQNARNIGLLEVCEDLGVQLEAEKQRHMRTQRELDRCIDARRANIDAIADALGVPKDVTRIDEAHRIALDNLAALRQSHAEAVEAFTTIELELDASEPRPPGGQQTGPRASDWQMTPSTRKALRRLASEAKARLT